jgi:hypothetical protein
VDGTPLDECPAGNVLNIKNGPEKRLTGIFRANKKMSGLAGSPVQKPNDLSAMTALAWPFLDHAYVTTPLISRLCFHVSHFCHLP